MNEFRDRLRLANMIDLQILGNNLRLIRTKQGREWTQTVVANALHVSQATYARFEKGYREPSLTFIVNFADLFEISIDTILGRKTSKDSLSSSELAPTDGKLTQAILASFAEDISSHQRSLFFALPPEVRDDVEEYAKYKLERYYEKHLENQEA